MLKLCKNRKAFVKRTIGAAAVILSLTAAGVSAEVNTWYDTFNAPGSLSTGWNNPNSVSMVKTDLMPSGYAIKGMTDKSIWISSTSKQTLVADNNYYMSYYLHTDGLSGTNKLFGIGLYNGSTAVLRVGVNTNKNELQIDRGQLAASKPITAYTGGKTYQVVARTWKGSAAQAAVAYVYDVETGKLVGRNPTTNALGSMDGILGERTVKIGSDGGCQGTQYISDFKLIEATGADKNVATKVVENDMPEVSFGDIPSEIPVEADKITIPEAATLAGGSTVTYTSSDEAVIDSEGNVYHGIADKRVFIIATVSQGSVEMERAYAVTVKGTGSAAVAKEDWSETDGALSGSYAPTDNGFAGAWKSDAALTEDSDAPIYSIGGQKAVLLEGNNTAEINTNTSLYNTLSQPIDTDSALTYYANSVINFNSAKHDGNARFAKVGFLNDEGNEISLVLMLRYAEDNTPWVGIKAGTKTTYSQNEDKTKAATINFGSLYNLLMKIETAADGEDKISVKLWQVGMQEPSEWTYTASAELAGKWSRIFAQTNTVQDFGLYFGGIDIEVYADEDVAVVASAEIAVKEYITNGTEPETVEWAIEDSIAEESYNNMKKLRTNAYIGDIAFTNGSTRISSLADASNTLKAVVSIVNESGVANTFNRNIFLAMYDENGTLESVDAVNPGNIEAQSGTEAELVLENVAGNRVRLFVFDNDIAPYIKDIELGNSVINY